MKHLKTSRPILMVVIIMTIMMVTIASIAKAQRSKSLGNGSTLWMKNRLSINPLMDGKKMELEVWDRFESEILYCYVGNLKFYFTDGSTMAVHNDMPVRGQSIFTTYFSLTKNQYKILGEKEIERWVLLFNDGTTIKDVPPSPDYIKKFI